MEAKKLAAKQRKREKKRRARKQLNAQYRAEAEQRRREAVAARPTSLERLREEIEASAGSEKWTVVFGSRQDSAAPATKDKAADLEQKRAEIAQEIRVTDLSTSVDADRIVVRVTGPDRPGVLAHVTNLISKHQVNIRQLHSTRDEQFPSLTFRLELPAESGPRHNPRRR